MMRVRMTCNVVFGERCLFWWGIHVLAGRKVVFLRVKSGKKMGGLAQVLALFSAFFLVPVELSQGNTMQRQMFIPLELSCDLGCRQFLCLILFFGMTCEKLFMFLLVLVLVLVVVVVVLVVLVVVVVLVLVLVLVVVLVLVLVVVNLRCLHLQSHTLVPMSVCTHHHQEFQVPKMEVLNHIRLFWVWVFPYISITYSFYRCFVPPFWVSEMFGDSTV